MAFLGHGLGFSGIPSFVALSLNLGPKRFNIFTIQPICISDDRRYRPVTNNPP